MPLSLCNKDSVRSIFKNFRISDIDIELYPDQNYAVIFLISAEEAQRAVSELHNTKSKGTRLTISQEKVERKNIVSAVKSMDIEAPRKVRFSQMPKNNSVGILAGRVSTKSVIRHIFGALDESEGTDNENSARQLV